MFDYRHFKLLLVLQVIFCIFTVMASNNVYSLLYNNIYDIYYVRVVNECQIYFTIF